MSCGRRRDRRVVGFKLGAEACREVGWESCVVWKTGVCGDRIRRLMPMWMRRK